jgi:hypothetical protein
MNARAAKIRYALCVGASLLLLGAMVVRGVERSSTGVPDQKYFDEVASAVARIPYRIGEWIGADVEAQAPAIALLRPNKLVQRRYTTTDGKPVFSLLFVHCLDARDMQGHYPPICYPAHGWIVRTSEPAQFVLMGASVPARVYGMTQVREGERENMTILNFFVVPSDEQQLAPDMEAVNRASAASARSWLGAAQVQVIVAGEASVEEMSRIASEISPAIEPAIHSLMQGTETDDR